MYARDYKTFHPGGYYHVFNRGNNKELIFLDQQDFLNFLKRLRIVLNLLPTPNIRQRGALRVRPLPKNSFSILAYCLMPNHFHFLIQQVSNVMIGELIKKVCVSYAMYFNRKYNRVGNIFQDTFKAKEILNDSYLTYLSAYIHNNPDSALNYPYSSLIEYSKQSLDQICNTEFILKYFDGDKNRYIDFVSGYSDKETEIIKDVLFEE
jgi:putative transposase